MEFRKISEKQINRTPSHVFSTAEKLIVSMKDRYLHVFTKDLSQVKKIPLAANTSSIAYDMKNHVFCGFKTGDIHKINLEDQEDVSTIKIDEKCVTSLNYDTITSALYVGSKNKKVKIYDSNLRCKNTMYGPKTYITHVSGYGSVVLCLCNSERMVYLFQVKDATYSLYSIKDSHEYPSVGSFISEDKFVVGTDGGNVHLFSTRKKTQISTLTTGGGDITCIIRHGKNFIVGNSSGDVIIGNDKCEVIGRIKVDGIVNSLSVFNDMLFIASGREYGDGRYLVLKDVKNKISIYEIK
jgi:WD40 repeat protein